MVQRYIIGVLGILVPSPTGNLTTYEDYAALEAEKAAVESNLEDASEEIEDLEVALNEAVGTIDTLLEQRDTMQARMTRLRHEWQTMKNQQRPTK